ncbi:hypothetical protein GCM10009738_25770 [Kitasatospora viridis]
MREPELSRPENHWHTTPPPPTMVRMTQYAIAENPAVAGAVAAAQAFAPAFAAAAIDGARS